MCVVWPRFIRQHSTQGNDRPSGSEDRAFAWFIYFRGSFYEELKRNLIRDLEVQIGNTLVPVGFHVLKIKQNKNHSLLLGRAFMDTVGAICNMQTNQLCLTLINPEVTMILSELWGHRRPTLGLTPDSLQHATAIMMMNTKPSIQDRSTAGLHHRST